jgi:hypothetical protein
MKSIIHSTKKVFPVLVTASLMGSTAFAANPHHALLERGTIESVNAKEMKLTVTDKGSHQPEVFAWTDQTKFLERHHLFGKSKPATADDLKQGEQVRIHYEKENGLSVAKTVVITSETSAPAHGTEPQS